MAVAELHQSDKSRENSKVKDKKERPLMKIVVRRLPPTMDQETFIEQVSPLPDYDYIYFVKGDMSLGEHAFSRAYINFINPLDIFAFKEKFDNYVFVDQKGHEYAAVVEFAMFQKIPRKRKPRLDPKCGTIETDSYYLEFLESLKVQPNQEEKPEYSYQFNTVNKDEVATTPLLDFIKQRRLNKLRIREERREQRKHRDLERKKLREEDQKRRQEQRTAVKTSRPKSLDTVTEHPVKSPEKQIEVEHETSDKNATISKDKKFYTSNSKPRFFSHAEKLDYFEKKSEFKKNANRKEDFNRDKEFRNRRFDEFKKDTPKKTKKYSEKREERRNEIRKKAEDATQDSQETKDGADDTTESINANIKSDDHYLESQSSIDDDSKDRGEKDFAKDDPRVQRRIRNKDRPTMAIYQPGMLSKRRVDGNEGETAVKE